MCFSSRCRGPTGRGYSQGGACPGGAARVGDDVRVTSPLSPTTRSSPRREKERAQTDRVTLHDVLDASLICHLGVVVDGVPLALPTVFAVDPDGPDEGGTLYLHGSVASRSLVQGPDQDVSVTLTLLDGIVLARSGFNHSMNYRSAVVIGRPRRVERRRRALPRARPARRPRHPRPVRRAAPADPQGAGRHDGAGAAAARGVGQAPRPATRSTRTRTSRTAGSGRASCRCALTGGDPVTSADVAGLAVPEHVVRRAADLR